VARKPTIAEVAPATAADTDELELRLRESDRQELIAALGHEQADEIGSIIRTRLEVPRCATWAMRYGDTLLCLFGVGPAINRRGEGCIWLLGTDAIKKHRRPFLAACQEWLPEMLRRYRVLFNYVDHRNRAALRWARWLGFKVAPPEPMGPLGLPFHRITIKR
jgi:hypothetical protein